MSQPDLPPTSAALRDALRAEIERLREDNARLRAALQPFAKCAGYLSGRVAVVELSDCRRAAEALAPPKEAPDAP